MEIDWSDAVIGVLCALLGAWIPYRLAGRERRRAEKAEKELELVKSRGEPPHFAPADFSVTELWTGVCEALRCDFGPSDGPEVLDGGRREIQRDTPAGAAVVMALQNLGPDAKTFSAEDNPHQIRLRREAQVHEALGRYWVEYPYDPAKHGHQLAFRVRYETVVGTHHTHTYHLTHGKHQMVRTEPAEP